MSGTGESRESAIDPSRMKRIAFYGGSFDPVHRGHLAIADELNRLFELDQFVFIPAYHAPHKSGRTPTSSYDRYAMLALATRNDCRLRVSKLELDLPEKPYTVETLARLQAAMPDTEVLFVMGADSWQDIRTWREWEKVLTMSSHIVVTRPGYDITFSHVTDEIRQRIVDIRGTDRLPEGTDLEKRSIFMTDAVNMDISATAIRRRIRENDPSWRADIQEEVAKYIEKYQIYR